MNARYRIEKWIGRITERDARMEREDVCFLMVQSRHLIETIPAPQKYRVVRFYADWVVHTTLDRSPICFEMLRDITEVLAQNWGSAKKDITAEISRVIGFPKLRAELLSLFQENELPTMLFEYFENWKGVLGALLWFLQGTPIRFPDNPEGRTKRIREEMLSIKKPANFAVEILQIIDYGGKPHWKIQLSGDKVITMIGLVSLGENRNDFSPSSRS